MRSKAFYLNSPFKFKLATHFTAFCYSNLDSEDLLQHVTAVILVFIVKDHSGIWVCSIKILRAHTVSVFSFTVVLCAYREFSLRVFIHLHKFYSILIYKFCLSQRHTHVALFSFIFHLQYCDYGFCDLVNLPNQIPSSGHLVHDTTKGVFDKSELFLPSTILLRCGIARYCSSTNWKISSVYALGTTCIWMVNFVAINQTLWNFPLTILV